MKQHWRLHHSEIVSFVLQKMFFRLETMFFFKKLTALTVAPCKWNNEMKAFKPVLKVVILPYWAFVQRRLSPVSLWSRLCGCSISIWCQLVSNLVSQLTGILCQVDPRQRRIPTSNSKKSSTFPFLILCHVETDENVKFHRGKQVYAL